MGKRPGTFEWTVATFAAAGLALTVATGAVLLNIKSRVVDRTLTEIADRSFEAIGRSLATTIWPNVGMLLHAGNAQTYAYADTLMAAYARDLDVLKIKIFDPAGRTIYSPVNREIGARTSNPAAFNEALERRSSIVSYADKPVESFDGPVVAGSAMAVYLPIRNLGGKVEAVAEIYLDNTQTRQKLESDLHRLDLTIVAILGALFAAMLAIVWRTARANARHEAMLEHERQRLADFTRVATGWVWETDADLRLTNLSDGVRAIGIDPAGEIGKSATEWRGATREDRSGPSFADLMVNRQEFRDVVIGFRRPDDRRMVWISRSAVPVFGDDGAFVGYRGTDRDMTPVVESARQLRLANVAQSGLLDELGKTRERLELALETAAMGWWELELTTGRQFWSPRAKEIWGFPPDAAPDYPMVLAAIHPEDRARHVDVTTATGSTARRSHRVVLPDGTLRYVREDFRIDRRADGSVARLFATVIDLTDIETLRIATEKDKATLDSALDAMAEGFAVYDADDRLLAFNRRFHELLGWTPEIGMSFSEITRRNISAMRPNAGPLLIDRLVAERVEKHRNPDGAFDVVVAVGGRYEVNETRTAAGFTVTTYSDITQARRDAEELAIAKAAAEEATRVKSRFLATMSHEIRTPMNGVLGMLELLVDTTLDTRQRGYLEVANRSARGLLAIIDDILDYSRLESGEMRIEHVAFDPAEIARQTVDLLTVGARRKGLELRIGVAAEVPARIGGDPTRFRQILLNLVGNAIKFTQAGSVDVRMSADPGEGDGAQLRVAVVDTGIGIDPEKLPRLFDHFSQADESIARRFGGSGLGLAISRELARLMGGELSATSVPGQGSTFELRVPATPAPAQAPRADDGGDARTGGRYRALDILVAEDNEINRIVVGEMLDRLGHFYTFARDGTEAVAAASAHDYDAILMDSQMPDVDGIEATRRIRALPAPRGRVPIVAQTANAMRGDREKYLAASMDGYIAKPLDAAELADVLERVTGVASKLADRPADRRAASPGSAAARRGLAALATALRAEGTED